ncbi:MAG: ArgR family transcriptional regulator [Spirochaetaceae bacterium]|nr:ArgR family transcriptional regulator [Spirochaetaceae bacterium]
MKGRVNRLKCIRKLIKNNRIESQEDLLGFLEKEGFEVTQATLSRDLKLLKVGKVSDGNSGYIYSLPDDDEKEENLSVAIQDFLRGYISIDFSGNIVVIKTLSGHTGAVASAVEMLAFQEILGVISGRDSCIFVCLREGVSGEQFLASLRSKIPDIDE